MNKAPGKSSVVKTLVSNRALRKIVVKNAKVAITSATTAIAARSAAGSGDAGSPNSATPNSKPASGTFDSKAVTSFVTTVAKPVAEKMATTQTGRSVLETLNSISGDALGKAPQRPDNPLNAFVTRLAGAAASARTGARPEQPEAAPVKFTPLQPAAAPTEPIKTVRWPPPKFDAAASNPSGTDTAPE